jgi:hypothetical protein
MPFLDSGTPNVVISWVSTVGVVVVVGVRLGQWMDQIYLVGAGVDARVEMGVGVRLGRWVGQM